MVHSSSSDNPFITIVTLIPNLPVTHQKGNRPQNHQGFHHLGCQSQRQLEGLGIIATWWFIPISQWILTPVIASYKWDK